MTDNNRNHPLVSVIIPCRNEARYIEACISSILAQEEPPGGIEIIVADGMSDDGTREILHRMLENEPRLILVDNPAQIKPNGVNAAIRIARGRYIAIMDAHNRYAEDYLLQAVKVSKQTRADNVGGAMFCEADGYVQRAVAAAFHHPFSVGGARWHNPDYEGSTATVYGGIYRREVFDRIGLFDEELVRNQDDELNLRLIRAGGKIWQSPSIKSWYSPRDSLSSLFRQYYQYGYWKVKVIQKHHLPASVRHLAPGLFVFLLGSLLVVILIGAAIYKLTHTPVIGEIVDNAAVLFFIQTGLYLLVNLTASIHTAVKSDWKLLPILPIVFACFHFGYGLGFIDGIRDFIILNRSPSTAKYKITR